MANEGQWLSGDTRETLINTETTVKRKFRSAWSGFLQFVLRDNVLEVAVGLMYVFPFTQIVSLVS